MDTQGLALVSHNTSQLQQCGWDFFYLVVTLKVVNFNIGEDINKRRKETE